MQCLGLTSERRRCRAEAVSASGYCLHHEQEIIRTSHTAHESPSAGRRMTHVLRKLGVSSARPMSPDLARFDAPSWLRASPTSEVIDQLLHHPESTVRWSAAFTLRKRQDPVAIEPLWQVLHHDASRPVRQQAAVALGKIGGRAALGPLIEGLVHDPDAGVRQACAIALGNLGSPLAGPDLVNALSSETAFFVRWDCILALGQVGDRTVVPLLTQLAHEESSEYLRRACRAAVVDIQQRAI